MKVYEAKLTYNLLRLGEETTLSTPDAVTSYMEDAFDEDPTVEWLYVILLDRKNHPLGRVMVTKGTATSSLVHPREVFKPAIVGGASALIVVHNHPSGDPAPSRADIQVTRQLREAAKVLGIDLLDHIVIGDKPADPQGLGYYSFNDAGLI